MHSLDAMEYTIYLFLALIERAKISDKPTNNTVFDIDDITELLHILMDTLDKPTYVCGIGLQPIVCPSAMPHQ